MRRLRGPGAVLGVTAVIFVSACSPGGGESSAPDPDDPDAGVEQTESRAKASPAIEPRSFAGSNPAWESTESRTVTRNEFSLDIASDGTVSFSSVIEYEELKGSRLEDPSRGCQGTETWTYNDVDLAFDPETSLATGTMTLSRITVHEGPICAELSLDPTVETTEAVVFEATIENERALVVIRFARLPESNPTPIELARV